MKNIKLSLLAIFTAFLCGTLPINSNATNDENYRKVANYGDSVLECAVFYQFMAEGLKTNPNTTEEVLKQTEYWRDYLFEGAGLLLTLAEVSTSAIKAKAQLMANNMSEKQQGSWANSSVLILEYGDKCKQLISSYDSKAKEIVGLLGLGS